MGDATYEGQFQDDMKHGQGKIKYDNEQNEVYEGSFKNDHKDGRGILQGHN